MRKWNGKTLFKKEIDLTIESDASLTGWGAVCSHQRTGGPWSQMEKMMLFGVAGSNSSSSNISKKLQQKIFATASR